LRRIFLCKLQIPGFHDPLNPHFLRRFRTFFVQKLRTDIRVRIVSLKKSTLRPTFSSRQLSGVPPTEPSSSATASVDPQR